MRYLFILLAVTPQVLLAQHPAIELQKLQKVKESEKVSFYIAISNGYAAGQPDSAVYYANKGIELAEKLDDRPGQAALLVVSGYINALHHHTELARSFFNQALSIYRRLNDAAGVAHTYDQLGLIDGDQKEFGNALKYYQDSQDNSGLIHTYEDIGKSFEEKRDRDKALSWYLRALVQYEHRKQQPEGYYILLENIGKLYQQKGDTLTAIQYLDEGLRKSKRQADGDDELHLLNDKGRVLEESRQAGKALETYKLALAEARKYNQPDEQAEALIGIANLLKKRDSKASLQDLQQALNIAKTLREPKLEARIYKALAGVHQQQSDYGEAMIALQEQHRLVDSLLNADTVKEIAALDSSYQLVRSQEQTSNLEHINKIETVALALALILAATVIIILCLLWFYLRKTKQLNEKLQQLNEDLVNSNRVKDTLFSVIGHDLKGPAGSAAQLFELMETEEFTPDEMKGMITELRKQTTASLELLKSLFEWGRAQLQGIKVNPADFSVEPVVARCIQLLSQQAAQKNIQLKTTLSQQLMIHADADHFEFIIRNLLSNAIKFSFKGGVIEVYAQLPGHNEVIFAVKDNGIGISKEQQAVFLTSNLAVSFGTNKEKGSGLGLLLTKDFVKANHGRIWLESEPGHGSTFFVAMPVVYAK